MGKKSNALFLEANQYIPGGVNSPVRAFQAVGGSPLFIEKGEGCRLYDADGKAYIEYCCSWGPLILGHRHPSVVEALNRVINKGWTFGAPTEVETIMAKEIVEAFPAMDMVRMVNSGTEATMSALRLARAFTKRDKIIKFEGCYHGHADALLVKAGSGAATFGVPSSPGVPQEMAEGTLTVKYNDLEGVEEIFKKQGEDIAALIVEPVAGNMGVVLPEEGFLEELRKITQEYGALLIFDEVMTGFRVAWGGVQVLKNIEPDLTCLGKIIGGGLPVGAYGGKREIMSQISPSGPVYQAGTLSGNPLAMEAGLATLRELKKPGVYEKLTLRTEKLAEGLSEAAKQSGVSVCINRIGAMLSCFFTKEKVYDFQSAAASDINMFKKFFQGMLDANVYIPPSQFEAWFTSLAHSDNDIEATVRASKKVFSNLI